MDLRGRPDQGGFAYDVNTGRLSEVFPDAKTNAG